MHRPEPPADSVSRYAGAHLQKLRAKVSFGEVYWHRLAEEGGGGLKTGGYTRGRRGGRKVGARKAPVSKPSTVRLTRSLNTKPAFSIESRWLGAPPSFWPSGLHSLAGLLPDQTSVTGAMRVLQEIEPSRSLSLSLSLGLRRESRPWMYVMDTVS